MNSRLTASTTAAQDPKAQDAVAEGDKPGPSTRKRLVVLLVKVAVSSSLILWVLRSTDLAEVAVSVRSASPIFVALAFLSTIGGYFISVTRWRILLRAQDVAARFSYLLRSYMIAVFFNQFLPSTFGGDAIRMYDAWRIGCSRVKAVLVVGLDRMLGMVALLIFALVAVSITNEVRQKAPVLWLWLLVGTALLLGAIALTFSTPGPALRVMGRITARLGGVVHRIGERAIAVLQAFGEKRGDLARALGLSLLLQTNVVVEYYLIGVALDVDISFGHYFLIIPVSLLTMAIPLSINGIGIRENVLAFLLGLYGVGIAQAVTLAWIAYSITLVQALVGGVVYAVRGDSISELVKSPGSVETGAIHSAEVTAAKH